MAKTQFEQMVWENWALTDSQSLVTGRVRVQLDHRHAHPGLHMPLTLHPLILLLSEYQQQPCRPALSAQLAATHSPALCFQSHLQMRTWRHGSCLLGRALSGPARLVVHPWIISDVHPCQIWFEVG